MKKVIALACCLMYSYTVHSGFVCASSVFTVQVPQKLCDQKSCLILFLQDQAGNQLVGKCHLDRDFGECIISEKELEIITTQSVTVVNAIDLKSVQVSPDDIVLHFEFDKAVNLLRILVIKDSFLADDMFDVLTLSLQDSQQLNKNNYAFSEFEDDLDSLSALVEGVESEAIQESLAHQKKSSMFGQYLLYAEIYMLMQYGRVKRAVSSWL